MINPRTLVVALKLLLVAFLFFPAVSLFYELSGYVMRHISSIIPTLLLLALGYGFCLMMNVLWSPPPKNSGAIAFHVLIQLILGFALAIVVHAILAQNHRVVIEGLFSLMALSWMGAMFTCMAVAIYCIFDN